MFVQTLNTPNPNSLKVLPGEKVSMSGPIEFTEKTNISNELIRNIVSEWCYRYFFSLMIFVSKQKFRKRLGRYKT